MEVTILMNIIIKKNFAPVPHKSCIDEFRQVRGVIMSLLRVIF